MFRALNIIERIGSRAKVARTNEKQCWNRRVSRYSLVLSGPSPVWNLGEVTKQDPTPQPTLHEIANHRRELLKIDGDIAGAITRINES